ncbi:MAG TPA: hypothetical protein VH165_07410 [Kofleriaceae bacterium]|jgi:lipopolysaccharide biosynthesis regulator YciM|nr:hypothetical protein [Kofleriaceae bacterium]
MGAALVLLLVGIGAMAAGVLIGRYYVPDDRQLRRSARHSRAYMRALSHLIARDYETAVHELRAVVEENVDDVEPYFALGALFRSRGEHERAIRVHQALAMRERDKRKLRQRAMYELGLDFRAAGMPRRATRAMEDVMLDDAGHEGAVRVLAALYEEQARFNEAAGLWQRIGRRRGEDTGHREHHLLVAAAQAAVGRDDLESAKELLKTAQKHETSAQFYAAAAELAAARGNHRGARERIKQALIAEPGLAPHLLPGLIAAEQGLARTAHHAPDGKVEHGDELDEDAAHPAASPAQLPAPPQLPAASSSQLPAVASLQLPAALSPQLSAASSVQLSAASSAQLPTVALLPAASSSQLPAAAVEALLPAAALELPAASGSAASSSAGSLQQLSATSSSQQLLAAGQAPAAAGPGATAAGTGAPSLSQRLSAAAGLASPASSAQPASSPQPASSAASAGPGAAEVALVRSGDVTGATATAVLASLREVEASPGSRRLSFVAVGEAGAEASAEVIERVLAVIDEVEAHSGPRLELALIRAQLVPPADAAAQAELAARLMTQFPESLAARVAAGRLASASDDRTAIRGSLDSLVSDTGALAWTLRGRWQCGHCSYRPSQFSWRCGQCRRWGTMRMETGIEPPPIQPRERRAAARTIRPETLLGASPDLPAATLDPGLSDAELASAGVRRSLLGRVGGWVSGVLRRDPP